ncbi:3-hydroxyacyl-CoA dehydrogenase family protein [Herbaspirillum sp. RTI4]|uniref:3-hydroxyacyl-CoA dehydrogenase family protein n=1 Tax=Herbaspirillum sp. RTI4 TaxID=3048640 RepID=UPI002AB50FFC|nr:3-hydroxyacyl-CoA dehydrogenase family protein [Herbaspirillum sp. RTI4]MDY7579130.1 3-hydroxyacyl-CoA dehydrogenase family protein [Herbaspirillum sp. RTI4]MEA9981291.1 3-hydroxyacyl-CoA dehydrogenase family protein [Herbaspirillum sp. RTI4]
MNPSYRIIQNGDSASFPGEHLFLSQAETDTRSAAVVYLGTGSGAAFRAAPDVPDAPNVPFIAIELGNECLGVHAGEPQNGVLTNVLGFARFRLGDAEPSALIELVRQSSTSEAALAAAKAAFEAAGLTVAVCNDFPGRIVNRLVRPYYNAALRRLDEKLATAADMDMTLRLGLGYPEGPIALLQRTGLADHYEVSHALYQALGQEPYAPARAAQVAHARQQKKEA